MTARLSLERGTLSRDIALASASLLGGLLMMALGVYHPLNPGLLDVPPGLYVGTLALTCLAVALRRVATRSGLALGTVAVAVDLAHGSSLATSLVYTQVLFDSCVYGPPRLRRRLLWITLALSGIAALIGVFLATPAWQGIGLAIPVVLIGVLPVVSGISVRQYRDQAAAERTRAEQTARLAELDRRQAVTAERSRMARELHDVIANHLSAVAIHATAALSVSGLDRAQLDQALRVIRENSVQGLAEMRQMIGLLREPAHGGPAPAGAASSPPPDPLDLPGGPWRGGEALPPGRLGAAEGPVRARLAEVGRLVGQARNAGLTVRFETTGEVRPLPVGVDLAAYRIVQESLTNALKHGAGPTNLTICHERSSVSVTIENPLARSGGAGAPGGAGVSAGVGLPGARAGLIGMRERVTLLGGRFEAGPRGSNWRVHAELPNAEPVATAPAPIGAARPPASGAVERADGHR
ncbi:sensor histidine kinase [Plantactinospora sp. WMMB334]|uniref:sensor histidine kinase n=1 Tax=Plantactinospora sp. WMMB334 TaxID=3404119 RepID=UPI003B94B1B3